MQASTSSGCYILEYKHLKNRLADGGADSNSNNRYIKIGTGKNVAKRVQNYATYSLPGDYKVYAVILCEPGHHFALERAIKAFCKDRRDMVTQIKQREIYQVNKADKRKFI
jgi:hypothetical protein